MSLSDVTPLHGPAELGDIGLDAQEWLDTLLLAGARKLDDAVHGPVIGQRQGRLPHFGGAFGQPGGLTHAIEQGVFGVNVEMDEWIGHGSKRQ